MYVSICVCVHVCVCASNRTLCLCLGVCVCVCGLDWIFIYSGDYNRLITIDPLEEKMQKDNIMNN